MASMELDDLLKFGVSKDASDIHVKANSPPLLRIYGDLIPISNIPPLTPDEAKRLTYSVLSPEQIAQFESNLELDLAYELPGISRFRMNVLQQRGCVGSFYRAIPYEIRSMEQLGLPDMCRRMCDRPRGLVLVTGPAGSGKSTTLAAMIAYINDKYPCHIVTVEDPVEFVHEDKLAMVNQRELGFDTHTFAAALKYVLRQDPDVILIGEMRDLETMQLAITAAETGHLVFATLHTTNAVQTVDRVIDAFPTHQQQQIRMQLSVNLNAVISQTLCKTADGKGRVPGFETMEAVPAVRNLIREMKTHQISNIIQIGSKIGMQSLNQSLANLVKSGRVKFEDAILKAGDWDEFKEIVYGERAAEEGEVRIGPEAAAKAATAATPRGGTADRAPA